MALKVRIERGGGIDGAQDAAPVLIVRAWPVEGADGRAEWAVEGALLPAIGDGMDENEWRHFEGLLAKLAKALVRVIDREISKDLAGG